MMKRQNTTSWPIFEIRNTDTAILPVGGIGFWGAIWAKVLMDRRTLEIKKLNLDLRQNPISMVYQERR